MTREIPLHNINEQVGFCRGSGFPHTHPLGFTGGVYPTPTQWPKPKALPLHANNPKVTPIYQSNIGSYSIAFIIVFYASYNIL